MGVRGASLFDVRGRWQALHDGSRGIPSWRGILGWRYSVMVALAHLGQVPPMGIHILTLLLRYSLAYHPFHTCCDTPSFLVLPPARPCVFFSFVNFTSLCVRSRASRNGNRSNEWHSARNCSPFVVVPKLETLHLNPVITDGYLLDSNTSLATDILEQSQTRID